jgi:hypothetical protein
VSSPQTPKPSRLGSSQALAPSVSAAICDAPSAVVSKGFFDAFAPFRVIDAFALDPDVPAAPVPAAPDPPPVPAAPPGPPTKSGHSSAHFVLTHVPYPASAAAPGMPQARSLVAQPAHVASIAHRLHSVSGTHAVSSAQHLLCKQASQAALSPVDAPQEPPAPAVPPLPPLSFPPQAVNSATHPTKKAVFPIPYSVVAVLRDLRSTVFSTIHVLWILRHKSNLMVDFRYSVSDRQSRACRTMWPGASGSACGRSGSRSS